MKTKSQSILAGLGLLLMATTVFAQGGSPDRLTIPLTDPSQPASLKVSLVQGGIAVKGYDGAEIIVEALRRGGKRKAKEPKGKAAGLRRIDMDATGLKVTEENNAVKISVGSPMRTVDLTIQVPRSTSLKLNTVNSGHLSVEGVAGEIEVTNVNGRIDVTDVAGSVVADTVNGGVKVTFTEVTSDKLMSFSSLNGDIDVTFPDGVRANVKMQTDNGSAYTDFDIQMEANRREPIVEERSERRGRYRVRTDAAIHGTINGGGPEFSFKTFNGDIFIRKAK